MEGEGEFDDGVEAREGAVAWPHFLDHDSAVAAAEEVDHASGEDGLGEPVGGGGDGCGLGVDGVDDAAAVVEVGAGVRGHGRRRLIGSGNCLMGKGAWSDAFADGPTAVDGERLAGAEACGVAEEPDDGGVEVLGEADAAAVEGLFVADEGEDIVIGGGAGGHGGIDEGRGDDVDADIVRGVAGGGGFAEADDGGFGCGVDVGGEEARGG